MSDPAARLLGIVLCGGKSKRMGRDKALLKDSSGTSFLQRTHDRLENVCNAVCVSASSVNASTYQQTIHCELILDPPKSCGPITGITQSLNYAGERHFDGCFFNPVDTPFLTLNDLQKLKKAFESDPTQTVCAVAGEATDRLEPLIAIYPTRLLSSFQQSIDNQQYSLQRVLQTLPIRRVLLPVQSCQNINEPSDLTSS